GYILDESDAEQQAATEVGVHKRERCEQQASTQRLTHPRTPRVGQPATSSASVDRDRHVVQQNFVHLGLLLLDARQDESRAGCRFEKTRLDLRSRFELDELLLERTRKPA